MIVNAIKIYNNNYGFIIFCVDRRLETKETNRGRKMDEGWVNTEPYYQSIYIYLSIYIYIYIYIYIKKDNDRYTIWYLYMLAITLW